MVKLINFLLQMQRLSWLCTVLRNFPTRLTLVFAEQKYWKCEFSVKDFNV